MRLDFAPTPNTYSANWMTQTLDVLRRATLPVLTSNTAAPQLLLQSPDGAVWRITIGNDGTIQRTKVQG
jgi:hypothetical protein